MILQNKDIPPVNQRIRDIIDSDYNGSVRAFCIALGFSDSQKVNRLFKIDPRNGKYPTPSIDILNLISNKFDISLSWLQNGGSEEAKRNTTHEATPKTISEFVQVPLVPIRAKAGYLVGYGDDVYIQTLPTVPVITDRTFHGKYRCFEVEGDSMDDGTRNAICDRDVILGREVGRQLWTCKLHYKDWLFVIVHREGILIKQIVDHKVNEGIIICHSLNPLYGEDFEVRLDEVSELYNVIKIVDRNAKL